MCVAARRRCRRMSGIRKAARTARHLRSDRMFVRSIDRSIDRLQIATALGNWRRNPRDTEIAPPPRCALEIISIWQLNRGRSADRPCAARRESEREGERYIYKGTRLWCAASRPAGISLRNVNLSLTRAAAESN